MCALCLSVTTMLIVRLFSVSASLTPVSFYAVFLLFLSMYVSLMYV